MQGMTVLVETLAQYSALMVMEHLYGRDQIRKFLKYELDRYLRSRGGELIEELPLERVENQPYIHYQKGSLVMYLLKDVVGEDAVNRALRGLIARVRFQGRAVSDVARSPAASPRRSRAGTAAADHRSLREDHALRREGDRARGSSRAPTARGTSLSTSRRASSTPTERARRPKRRSTSRSTSACSPPSRARRISPGRRAALRAQADSHGHSRRSTLVAAREPTFAGVDPYNKRIDRNSEDNVRAIDQAP